MQGSITHLVPALVVGTAAGLHISSWGMFKDALYEGFSPAKYARSVLVGILAALALQAWFRFPLGSAAGLLALFGTSYALERFLVESWKAFIRDEDQSKYFIPMAFAVGGRVVRGRGARLLAGLGYGGAVVTIVALLIAAQPTDHAPPFGALLAAGTIGGWLSAFGGAWKDAPKEGFQLLKFFRSPVMALAYGALLAHVSQHYAVVAFAALGLTVATIETHKKFNNRFVAPGKFGGRRVTHPEMYALRLRVVPVFVAVWALLLGTIALTLGEAGLLPIPTVAEAWELTRGR